MKLCYSKCRYGSLKSYLSFIYNMSLYTEILKVNLFAFAYRLFHEDFSPIYEAFI